MTDEKFAEREIERANRLLVFVKAEILNMCVGARFIFAAEIVKYLKPEIEAMQRESQ